MQNAECKVQNGAKCETCRNKGYCIICDSCIHEPERKDNYEPLTNADRIRAMSDEELCNFIMEAPAIPCDEKISAMMKDNGCTNCEKCVMDWLQQPVEDISEAVSNCGAGMDGDGDG